MERKKSAVIQFSLMSLLYLLGYMLFPAVEELIKLFVVGAPG